MVPDVRERSAMAGILNSASSILNISGVIGVGAVAWQAAPDWRRGKR